MKSRVDEIAPDVYRISTFQPDYGIEFKQFLIKDDEPFLMHTGLRKMFQFTLEGVASVIDPSTLRWIGYSHFEPDECGALNEWLNIAPQATPVAGQVGAIVMLGDFADRAPRMLNDGEVLELGRNRLQFISTPHLPHGWDAGLFFEQTQRTLLCSDLFFQPGENEPLIESDIVGRAKEAIIAGQLGPLANDMPYTPYTDRLLHKLADLAPQTFAVMHGSSYRGDGRAAMLDLAQVIKETHGRAQ